MATAGQAREDTASHGAGVSPEPVARDAAEPAGARPAAGWQALAGTGASEQPLPIEFPVGDDVRATFDGYGNLQGVITEEEDEDEEAEEEAPEGEVNSDQAAMGAAPPTPRGEVGPPPGLPGPPEPRPPVIDLAQDEDDAAPPMGGGLPADPLAEIQAWWDSFTWSLVQERLDGFLINPWTLLSEVATIFVMAVSGQARPAMGAMIFTAVSIWRTLAAIRNATAEAVVAAAGAVALGMRATGASWPGYLSGAIAIGLSLAWGSPCMARWTAAWRRALRKRKMRPVRDTFGSKLAAAKARTAAKVHLAESEATVGNR